MLTEDKVRRSKAGQTIESSMKKRRKMLMKKKYYLLDNKNHRKNPKLMGQKN
jgi:hypothetical protein